MPKQPGKSLAPVFLRCALGLTFLWAGLGKIEGQMPVQGASAAALANMGVIEVINKAAPDAPIVAPTVVPAINPNPTLTRPPLPTPTKGDPDKPGTVGPSAEQPPSSLTPGTPPASPPADSPTPPPSNAPTKPALIGPQQLTAANFPDALRVPRVYGMALLLRNAANPPVKDTGAPGKSLWPKSLAGGRWPVILGWTVAVGEAACGIFVLLGILTRMSSWGMVGIMLGAVWLTQVGPALQTGNTMLGILPKHELYSVDQWQPLLWQFSLLMSALALAFMGPGPFSLDRRLFPPSPPAPPSTTLTARGRPI